jgi:hypothetical protein
MIFMYVTTMAAILVTAYNLYASILSNPKIAAQPINTIGAIAMMIVAGLLFVAALFIAYDAFKAWRKLDLKPVTPTPARERELVAAAHD